MKTSKYLTFALALGTAALAGCATATVNSVENTPKVGQPMIIDDQRVITDSGLARAVAIEALNTITTPAGLLKVQVRLKNHTFSQENFLYHFEWFDINGMEVNNVVSAALPEQIEAGETKFITGIAPNPDCKDFRVKFIAGN